MTFSANDFHRDADELLRELGYEVCGDDDDGWAFHFGGPNSTTRGPQVDTAEQASASALKDLTIGTQDLLAAARAVLDSWESGHLAAAVSELATCVRVLDPDERGGSPEASRSLHEERLAHRLQRLAKDGLDFSTCVRTFGVKADIDPIARTARLNYQREGELEIDDYTVISRGDDCGAYVLSWVWVATRTLEAQPTMAF